MLRLKVERQKRGLSQFQLAVKSGINPTIISRLERGVWPPYTGWKVRIAKALEWPIERADELFKEVKEV